VDCQSWLLRVARRAGERQAVVWCLFHAATRPIGTFSEIWPGCFGWRARLWGVFQQIVEIGQVWGREIAGYAEFSVEIGQDVWRLSALFVLANGISAKVL
jgi:hypothetical protein